MVPHVITPVSGQHIRLPDGDEAGRDCGGDSHAADLERRI